MPRPGRRNLERMALALVGSVIEIDPEGRVWRISRYGRPCARHRAESRALDGYLRVPLTIPGVGYRPVLAHRLVYEAHRGEIPAGAVVFPRDGDWANTHPENLAVRPGKKATAPT